MKRNLQKGFTLIELLVVVAIIGILSSMVLVSLNKAREKGRDASAKGSLSSIRAAAEIFYDSNDNWYNGGSLGDMCADDTNIQSLLIAAENQTGSTNDCEANQHSYTAGIMLNSDHYFCVDSTGFAGEFNASSIPLSAPLSPGISCLN